MWTNLKRDSNFKFEEPREMYGVYEYLWLPRGKIVHWVFNMSRLLISFSYLAAKWCVDFLGENLKMGHKVVDFFHIQIVINWQEIPNMSACSSWKENYGRKNGTVYKGKENTIKPVLNSLEINTQNLHVLQFERKRKKQSTMSQQTPCLFEEITWHPLWN